MKALEQFVVRARTRIRAERARFGLGDRPARLLLRLDEFDAPGPVAASARTVDDWFDAVVRVVEWSGPLPVTLVSRPGNPLLADLVRFAHRLECPTTLRTEAAGLGQARADELVDCGLQRVVLCVGRSGASGAAGAAAAGELRLAAAALRSAREFRGVALAIEIELAFGGVSPSELEALGSAASGAGADGVCVAPGWEGGPYDAAAHGALASVLAMPAVAARSAGAEAAVRAMDGRGPGAARASGSCPVGALQVELLPDATVRSCPFKPDVAALGDEMASAWRALSAHRSAIRTCGRSCAHPLLSA